MTTKMVNKDSMSERAIRRKDGRSILSRNEKDFRRVMVIIRKVKNAFRSRMSNLIPVGGSFSSFQKVSETTHS